MSGAQYMLARALLPPGCLGAYLLQYSHQSLHPLLLRSGVPARRAAPVRQMVSTQALNKRVAEPDAAGDGCGSTSVSRCCGDGTQVRDGEGTAGSICAVSWRQPGASRRTAARTPPRHVQTVTQRPHTYSTHLLTKPLSPATAAAPTFDVLHHERTEAVQVMSASRAPQQPAQPCPGLGLAPGP